MQVSVTLCYAAADRVAALAIAARLERCAEVRVFREELRGLDRLPDIWDRGENSEGLLLLLSPDAVPRQSGREAWHDVLEHLETNEPPSLATALVRPCTVPPVLRRKHSYDAATLRPIQQWALSLHRRTRQLSFIPAALHLEGRAAELDRLHQWLVDGSGTAALIGAGKTALAQEFARTARGFFRDTIWIVCGDRSATSIRAEAASALGLPLDHVESPAIERELAQRRVLVILDDVMDELPFCAPFDGCGSVLLTTRNEALVLPEHADVLQISPFTRPAPIAPSDNLLWRAMSVCRPGRVPLILAAKIAEVSASAVERLIELRVADPLDRATGLYRLNVCAALDDELRARHASTLCDWMKHWRRQPELCKLVLPEVEPAYRWAERVDWPLAADLARQAFRYLLSANRAAEIGELLVRVEEDARLHQDADTQAFASSELSWLGRFDRAPVRFEMPATQGSLFTLDMEPLRIE